MRRRKFLRKFAKGVLGVGCVGSVIAPLTKRVRNKVKSNEVLIRYGLPPVRANCRCSVTADNGERIVINKMGIVIDNLAKNIDESLMDACKKYRERV